MGLFADFAPTSLSFLGSCELEFNDAGVTTNKFVDTPDISFIARIGASKTLEDFFMQLEASRYTDIQTALGGPVMAAGDLYTEALVQPISAIFIGHDRDVLLVSVAPDRLRARLRVSLGLVPGKIPLPVADDDLQALCVAALALAVRMGPLVLYGARTPITPPLRQSAVTLITLSNGRSATLDAFGDHPPAYPLLGDLTFNGERSFKIHDIDQTGLFDHETGKIAVMLPDGRTGMLRIERALAQPGYPELSWALLTLDDQDRIAALIANRWPRITEKEAEVLTLLVSGHTTKEAAAKLEKSITTTSIQARAALQKTGFHSIESLLTYLRLMTA